LLCVAFRVSCLSGTGTQNNDVVSRGRDWKVNEILNVSVAQKLSIRNKMNVESVSGCLIGCGSCIMFVVVSTDYTCLPIAAKRIHSLAVSNYVVNEKLKE
jgi:hypothetical protein